VVVHCEGSGWVGCVCDDGDDRMWSFYVWLWGGGAGAPRAALRGEGVV